MPVSPSHDRKGRYFQFTLQTENIEQRVVCFSPEKHKHLTKIEENETGCQLKRFKVNEKNKNLIDDNTTLRESKADFARQNKQRETVTVSHVNNEANIWHCEFSNTCVQCFTNPNN